MAHGLVVLEHYEFCEIFRQHQEQLLACQSPADIGIIQQEHQEPLADYTQENKLQLMFNACDNKTTHDEAWKIVKARLKFLLRFCGGLSSFFPVNTQAESDFYIVKGQKDVLRKSLTDLSLEGVLHSTHFDMLKGIQGYLKGFEEDPYLAP